MRHRNAPKGHGRDDYAACAAQGLSKAETARHLGVSKQSVCWAARAYGLTFAAGVQSVSFRARARRLMLANCCADGQSARERTTGLHRAGFFLQMRAMTPDQRADYRALRRKGGYSLQHALAAVMA